MIDSVLLGYWLVVEIGGNCFYQYRYADGTIINTKFMLNVR